ncbi:hypothetical protein KP509_14G056100 [Ceratopteris richardii]|uniref:Uncharacterized protein n=1 Tax=Ceratopteris richardii TaxID=49495 RepID=A0A8T2QW79_CERRI|nr:hypothetical protein KP509_31G001200 [Ceratopteris richardii]KAH7415664.1 hypothetical protein KP509_14G056100 [Ceratopteris richardii]
MTGEGYVSTYSIDDIIMVRSSQSGICSSTFIFAPVSSRIFFIILPDLPMILPILELGHRKRIKNSSSVAPSACAFVPVPAEGMEKSHLFPISASPYIPPYIPPYE